MSISKLNYVNVGPQGAFTKGGVTETTPADIDALFDHLHSGSVNKLVLHFHGGLIREREGLVIAEKIWSLFKNDAHPVTFIWETGFLETVKNNLETLNSTKLFQKAVIYAIRHAAKLIGGGIGAKGPGQEMTLDEIEAELDKARGFDQFDVGARSAATAMDEEELKASREEIQVELEMELEADAEIEQILLEEAPVTDLLNDDVVHQIENEAARGIVSTLTLAKHLAEVVFRVVRRFIRHRDHGLYPTVVEEVLRQLYLADFGAWVWGSMKRVAEEMWAPNESPISQKSHVGTYFLERLVSLQTERPELVVDLVGHSAGSIAICQLLRTLAEGALSLKIRNVLFLAPACTSDLFYSSIVSRPELFAHFRMFTMSAELETQDRLVPRVYNRSLLYLISGVLEEEADQPLAGIEFQCRGVDPYADASLRAVCEFLRNPEEHRLVLSETTGATPGLNSASRTHGDFDDDPQTLSSLRTIVSL